MGMKMDRNTKICIVIFIMVSLIGAIIFASNYISIYNSHRGTIKYIDMEGGFYGIITNDGKKYDPINLPIAYKIDGLKVQIDGKERKELGSSHMWGTPYEITEINKV
jgi:hypothetical protein